MIPRLLQLVLLAALVASAGCERGTRGTDAAEGAAEPVGVQPLSPAEIEAEAEPMTPERAEELGVVDTTIQVAEEP